LEEDEDEERMEDGEGAGHRGARLRWELGEAHGEEERRTEEEAAGWTEEGAAAWTEEEEAAWPGAFVPTPVQPLPEAFGLHLAQRAVAILLLVLLSGVLLAALAFGVACAGGADGGLC